MSEKRALRAVPADGNQLSPGTVATASVVLGSHLRRLREDQGLNLADVARDKMVGSASTLSRMENGKTLFQEGTVLALVKYYGIVDPAEQEGFREMIRASRRTEWWSEFKDVIPGWMGRLISVESAASEIRTYELQFVPGLVQIPDYTRALMTMHARGITAQKLERKVILRQRRQQLLQQVDSPTYMAVLDEGLLAKPVGGTSVMRGQLRHLYNLAENKKGVHIRVLPHQAAETILSPSPSIACMKFPSDDVPEMTYLEHGNGADYLKSQGDLEYYRLMMTNLWEAAADRKQSMDMIQSYIDRMGK